MTRSRSLLLVLALAVVAALAPGSTAAAAPPTADAAAAKKKTCKKGYKVVKVRRKGRVRRVCRRKRAKTPVTQTPQSGSPQGPAGPSVAEVEQIIRGLAQANVRYGFPPETVEVTFEQPTRIGSMVMYDPYEGDPLHAGGPIEAWPVRAWVKEVGRYDDTPEDDTTYGGCLGHLNSYWPYDSLHMFYRDDMGSWAFRSSSAKPGDCG